METAFGDGVSLFLPHPAYADRVGKWSLQPESRPEIHCMVACLAFSLRRCPHLESERGKVGSRHANHRRAASTVLRPT